MMHEFLLSISDVVGITGVVLILIGYLLINTGKLKSTHLIYPLMNGVGAVLILFSLFFHWNLSSVIIEVAWVSISIFGVLKIARARKI